MVQSVTVTKRAVAIVTVGGNVKAAMRIVLARTTTLNVPVSATMVALPGCAWMLIGIVIGDFVKSAMMERVKINVQLSENIVIMIQVSVKIV